MKKHQLEVKSHPRKKVKRFESDTAKIVHRHLENEDDVITDEDIRNIRVGLTPPVDDIEPRSENFAEIVDDIEEEQKDTDEDVKRTDNPVTPWDAVEH